MPVKICNIIYKLSCSWETVQGKHLVDPIFSSAERYHLVSHHGTSSSDSWSTFSAAAFHFSDSCVFAFSWTAICCFRANIPSKTSLSLSGEPIGRWACNHFWMRSESRWFVCFYLFWVYLLFLWVVYRETTILLAVVFSFARPNQKFWIFWSWKRKWGQKWLTVLSHS